MRASTAAGFSSRSVSPRAPAPGAVPDWAVSGPAGLHLFVMKMLIVHWVLKGKATPTGSRLFALFISFSGAPCAEVRADQPGYCESAEMGEAGRVSSPRDISDLLVFLRNGSKISGNPEKHLSFIYI